MKRMKDGWEKQLVDGRERLLEELKAKWISLGMMHEEDARLLGLCGRPLSSEHRKIKG